MRIQTKDASVIKKSIDVRAPVPIKQLLQEAARLSNKSVSHYLLDVGVMAAEQAMADRRHFGLDEARWQQFLDVLDQPVQPKPQLKKRLRKPGVLG